MALPQALAGSSLPSWRDGPARLPDRSDVVGAEYMPTCGSEPLTIGPREGHFSNSSGQSRWTEFVHDFREALFTCVANQTGIPRTENDNRFSRSKVIRNLRWKRSFHGSSS